MLFIVFSFNEGREWGVVYMILFTKSRTFIKYSIIKLNENYYTLKNKCFVHKTIDS